MALCGIFTAFAGRSRHSRLFLMNEAFVKRKNKHLRALQERRSIAQGASLRAERTGRPALGKYFQKSPALKGRRNVLVYINNNDFTSHFQRSFLFYAF
jgi:hypothetical protein